MNKIRKRDNVCLMSTDEQKTQEIRLFEEESSKFTKDMYDSLVLVVAGHAVGHNHDPNAVASAIWLLERTNPLTRQFNPELARP